MAVSFLRVPIPTVYPNPHLVGAPLRAFNNLSDGLVGNKSPGVLMPGKQVQLRSRSKRHGSPTVFQGAAVLILDISLARRQALAS